MATRYNIWFQVYGLLNKHDVRPNVKHVALLVAKALLWI